jgi:hypothetical protein
MSPRKPTIDDLDDIDDQDGILEEEEEATPTDLDLSVVDADEITGAVPPELEEEEER